MTPDLRARCEVFLRTKLNADYVFYHENVMRAFQEDVTTLEAFAREIRRETLEEVRQYYESVFNRQFTLVGGDAVAFKRWLDAQLKAEGGET